MNGQEGDWRECLGLYGICVGKTFIQYSGDIS